MLFIWIALSVWAMAMHTALAGPGSHLDLINATPYEWRLIYSHSYHIQWKPSPSIAPGKSVHDYHEFAQGHKDEAAEATYELVGNPQKATFTVKARADGKKRIEVQYQGGLHSLNNPEFSILNLGWQHNGAVSFLLSGDGVDTPFISTNPPVGWMQATLATISHLTMREIAMPASHDAGISEMTRRYFGVKHNVLTQTAHVYGQLLNGARYLDIRPAVRGKKWYTSHLSKFAGTYVGGFGRTIPNVVTDINQFTAEYPGELIIVDLSHAADEERKFKPLHEYQWQDLYTEINKINDIWYAPEEPVEDLSTLPLSTFIKPGSRSAVIIRVPNGAPLPQTRIRRRDDPASSTEIVNSSAEYDIGITEDANGNPREPAVLATITALPTDVPHDVPIRLRKSPALSTLTQVPRPIVSLKGRPGFFHERRLPQTGSYSDTDQESVLSRDQLYKLARFRPSRQDYPHRSTWIITQKVAHLLDITVKRHSIIGLSSRAHRTLLRDLWNNLTPQTYPNLLEIDDVWNSQFAAFCMAINEQFAAKGADQVGTLG